MSAKTGIQWTDHTFNIAWGCIKVSPGCENCYALTLSRRYGFDVWGPAKTTARRTFGAKHWAEPLRWNAAAETEGVRKKVFCSSMADVFEDHPTIDAEREKLWPLIRATPWLDWQILTKRPERIAANLPADWGSGYANVWLGTSVESQKYADERIPELLAVPAVIHFLSGEPLLGPVALGEAFLVGRFIECVSIDEGHGDPCVGCMGWSGTGGDECGAVRTARIDWVIVGGESGPRARPMDLAWVRELVAECGFAGAAVFVKQLGARPLCANDDARNWPGDTMPLRDDYEPHHQGEVAPLDLNDAHGGDMAEWPEDLRVREFPTPRRTT